MGIDSIRASGRTEMSFAELSSRREAFQGALSRALSRQVSSRPPKMEFSGTLVATQDPVRKRRFPFALRTKMNQYGLHVEGELNSLACLLQGKEVLVRGAFDFEEFAVEVEELAPIGENQRIGSTQN
jgi:hypothetical protein